MHATHFIRRIAVAAGAGAFVLAGLGSTASAWAHSGIKGSPQPELKPFVIGTANGGSDTTTDGYNGTLIIAYNVSTPNADGAIDVCVVKRGARSCESNTTLNTENNSSVFSRPLVTVETGGTVYVAMDECCYAPYLLFRSDDGGKTFGAPVPIGPSNPPNMDASETWGNPSVHMMWAPNDAGSSFPVEVASPGDPGAGQVVTAMTDSSGVFFTAGLGSYAGEIIAAGSDSNDVTFASVAPAASTVFHSVGQFPGEQLLGVNGMAMLTQQTGGSQSDVLRLFNGTGFGAAAVVPHGGGGGPNWDAVFQGGTRTFVFTERYQDGYNLEMQSTVSGSSWTPRTNLGDAINSSGFSGSLDGIGSGAVVGTPGPVTFFPVLAPQFVSLKLSNHKVSPGTKVTVSGVSSDPAAGRTVELQVLKHGRWHNVATTSEHSNGHFKFHITRHAAGDYTYRASVADLPGYYEYGYSSGRVLKVV